MASFATNNTANALNSNVLDAGLPADATKLHYMLRKNNVKKNETTDSQTTVVFNETHFYMIEHVGFQPLTMRFDLFLLQSLVDADGKPLADTESPAIKADFWSSGLDFDGKRNGKPIGWIEPVRQAYRFSFDHNGLAFRIDAPKGKNNVYRTLYMPTAIVNLLCGLIKTAKQGESPVNVNTNAELSQSDLAMLAKYKSE